MLAVQEEMDGVVQQMRAALGDAPFLGTFTFGEQGCFVGGDNYRQSRSPSWCSRPDVTEPVDDDAREQLRELRLDHHRALRAADEQKDQTNSLLAVVRLLADQQTPMLTCHRF